MKLGRLNHVGVATPDIDAAIAFWRDTMGATRITEPFDMLLTLDSPSHARARAIQNAINDAFPRGVGDRQDTAKGRND